METISFAGDGLGADLVPHEELADCAATALGADGKRILSYGTGAGYTPLRELIAELLKVHPFRVVLTNGWLQGFSLLVDGRVANESVIVEYPPPSRALKALFARGANIVYADWLDAGIALDLFQANLRGVGSVGLAYTMPTFHDPTGLCLTVDERWEIGSALYKREVLTVEDDPYGVLRFEGEPIQTLFELSLQSFVYSSTFSTSVAPGLRVGYFVLPEDMVNELTTRANSTYITPPLLPQATVFEFIRRGAYDRHVGWLRERLRERRDALLDALERHFGELAAWTRPEGGIFLQLTLPPGTDAKAVLAGTAGVAADAGSDLLGLPHTIRLNYAAVPPELIEPGIERLAEAFRTAPVESAPFG